MLLLDGQGPATDASGQSGVAGRSDGPRPGARGGTTPGRAATPVPDPRAHTPRLVQTPSAHPQIDRHWAVAAFGPAQGILGRAAAVAAWEPGGDGDAVLPLDETESGSAAQLAAAYDLAARDLAMRLPRLPDEERRAAQQEVELAAARSFLLYAALPGPDDPRELALRKLQLVALGEIGALAPQWERWLRRHPEPPGRDVRPWDVALLEALAELWTELLRRAGGAEYPRAMEIIARLREERPTREAALLLGLTGREAERTRFYLFALYQAVDAATDLLMFFLHHRPANLGHLLALHFGLAREATSGDLRLDVLFSWMQSAALRVSQEHTQQLNLPGLTA